MRHYTEFRAEEFHPLLFSRKKGDVSDNVFTFDIETVNLYRWKDGSVTGFDYSKSPKEYEKAVKTGYMVIWQFSVDDVVFYGRRWEEFESFLAEVRAAFEGKLIVFIHNLSFEFQFLRNVIEDFDVFARMPREPMKAFSPSLNIEFRCSYQLAGMALESVPKEFNLSIKKLVGKWDYDKVRTPETPLDVDELSYAEYDCIVAAAMIKKLRDEYGHVENIPLTKTGRLRRKIEELYENDWHFKMKVSSMNERDPQLFRKLNRCFAGGYTHANAYYTGKLLHDIGNYDIASSYPTVLVAEKFPWGHFVPSGVKHFRDLNPKFAYIMKVKMKNVRSLLDNHYLQFSKMDRIRGGLYDNGRIAEASYVEFWCTDVDVQIIEKAYKIEACRIIEAYCAPYRYLDTRFVSYVLKLYGEKTALKNVEGQEFAYAISKTFINAMYGDLCLNVVRDDVVFEGNEWKDPKPDDEASVAAKLEKFARPYKCYKSYAWGIWVSAYARRNLWKIILQCDRAVVYCDTDSIKYWIKESAGRVEAAVARYNVGIERKLREACRWHGLDFELTRPLDSFGEAHPLGVFERDPDYIDFKTFGAKKYAYRDTKGVHTTVAGVAKTYRDGDKRLVYLPAVKDFRLGFTWGYRVSGRTTAYYNENQTATTVNGYTFSERYGIVVAPTTYTLGVHGDYETFFTKTMSTHTNSSYLMGGNKFEEIL